MKKIICIAILGLFYQNLFSQEKFHLHELDFPDKYGEKIKKMFVITEIPEFFVDSTIENTIYLENGLRQHDFKNINAWFNTKKEIDTVKEINIVFSKYPVRNGVYMMLVPLLFNRLKELFELDPELNDKAIKWKITLQTNCPTDAATAKLFHGIVIKYLKYSEDKDSENEVVEVINTKKYKKTTTGYMEEFYDIPEDLKKEIDTSKSKLKQEKLILKYLEEKVIRGRGDTATTKDKEELLELEKKLRSYEDIHTYGGTDSTILKVFERTKWDNALVVCDWTGSMYSYGGQLLLWHMKNIDTSGLKYLTLFNDGDNKRQLEKRIGSTGGIYHTKMNNINFVFDLYNLVMFRGYGGDGPENDIEAILASIKHFQLARPSEVILIADNSCVRDMELLEKVKVPVHVILCGYYPYRRINPQYFDIAMKTNGSLHTMEFDLSANYYNSLEPNKAVKFLKDSLKMTEYEFCSSHLPRYRPTYKFKNTIDTTRYINIDSAMVAKSSNVILDISNKQIEKLSKKTFKVPKLISLDVSNNLVEKIPSNIDEAIRLNELSFQNNSLKKIPDEFCFLRNLKSLDLSSNQIEELPDVFSFMRQLEYLNLSDNNLENLPARFYFSKLVILSLKNNRLETLPYFGGMRKLKILDLSDNKLSELPTSIVRLKSLEELDLSNNNLKELPTHMYRLSNLKRLVLIGNPISDEELLRVENLFPNLQIEI